MLSSSSKTNVPVVKSSFPSSIENNSTYKAKASPSAVVPNNVKSLLKYPIFTVLRNSSTNPEVISKTSPSIEISFESSLEDEESSSSLLQEVSIAVETNNKV